ncbi:ABC transporter substrate-binding protein [Arthrobacter sp. MYb227]|nr:ABC transporter substrate-binding protein [Arthrobacter sp. MYb227]
MKVPTESSRRSFLAGSLGLAALSLTACVPQKSTPTPSETPAEQLFTLGTAANPATLDPALSGDNETFRVTRQIYEGLVGVDRETGAAVPLLATDWISSPDRLQYTFILRRNVKFHDGTDFNAEAVVLNFQRWAALPLSARQDSDQGFTQVFRYNDSLPKLPDSLPEPKPVEGPDGTESIDPALEAQHQSAMEELEKLREDLQINPFLGASTGASANYFGSIKAADTHTVVLTLRRPITGLIEALTLPGMAIASPKALATAPTDPKQLSWLATHPMGTGPYAFSSWENSTVTVKRFDGYWDSADFTQNPDAPTIINFKETSTPARRLGDLRRKEIDGFDMVTVSGLRELVREGNLIVERDPFSVAYLGMNQKNKWLANLKFRQAVAHSIDRTKIINEFYIKGTKEARSFLPASLGISPSDTYYGPDTQKAKDLLAESGYDGSPIPFLYPLNISRAYLPLPELTYAEISRQLASNGINVQPIPVEWTNGYVARVRAGDSPGFHLLGFNGGYRDPDDFLGGIFSETSSQFGYNSPILQAQILLARSLEVGEERSTAYQEISSTLAQDLPALPLTFPISGLAFNDTVRNYPSSPVLDEVFSGVKLNIK